ncbi:hypothetical protein LTR78_002116 [Recurvomyces mirabilis]|uniref:Uncharacterized protein n=1 Tax=Recurvomyces mirabilis TaxID=574656 RepID=A0AAE0WU83_9PEZI|nr:hypothetical protein LTR78_002116 [Recurvomyces mirabilis]KAK5160574.1 hypothetical protein LTS14_001586 [Recurvomyces mirabilis]
MMFPLVQHIDMLPHLHTQHNYYNSELADVHKTLGKQYKKLARAERALDQREEKGLSRKEKKKLQWARSVTRNIVQKLEWQRRIVEDDLRRCNNLIAWHEPSVYHLPTKPWTAHLPQSPFTPFSPYSPAGPSPWHAPAMPPRPQYWDLSVIRERRRSSPNVSSTDSGFYEPAMYGRPVFGDHADIAIDTNHIFAHEIMSASVYSPVEGAAFTPDSRSKKSSLSSEKDDVPELVKSPPISYARAGAACDVDELRGHRRRFSENAIQFIESRMATAKDHHRGASVGPVPSDRRRGD